MLESDFKMASSIAVKLHQTVFHQECKKNESDLSVSESDEEPVEMELPPKKMVATSVEVL